MMEEKRQTEFSEESDCHQEKTHENKEEINDGINKTESIISFNNTPLKDQVSSIYKNNESDFDESSLYGSENMVIKNDSPDQKQYAKFGFIFAVIYGITRGMTEFLFRKA